MLNEAAIAECMASAPGWERRGASIVRTFDCGDFDGSLRFVNAVAAAANAANHHPDIAIAWGSVTLSLTSHDAGGLTERDFALARTVEGLRTG